MVQSVAPGHSVMWHFKNGKYYIKEIHSRRDYLLLLSSKLELLWTDCEAGNDCLSSQYVLSLSKLLEGLLPRSTTVCDRINRTP